MSCPDWKPLVEGRADGEERERLKGHLASCPRCRNAALREDPLILFSCRADVEIAAGEVAAMRQRVAGAITQLDGAPRRTRSSVTKLWRRLSGAAAGLLLGLGLTALPGWLEDDGSTVVAAALGADAGTESEDWLKNLPIVEGYEVRYQASGPSFDFVEIATNGRDL